MEERVRKAEGSAIRCGAILSSRPIFSSRIPIFESEGRKGGTPAMLEAAWADALAEDPEAVWRDMVKIAASEFSQLMSGNRRQEAAESRAFDIPRIDS
jgi:hypothetical protein